MYQIVISPNFYAGTLGAPQEKLLTFGDLPEDHADFKAYDSEIVDFETEEEANKIINQLNSFERYVLRHGEYSAPDYTVVNDFDFGDHCINLQKYKGFNKISDPVLIVELEKLFLGVNVEYCDSSGDTDFYCEYAKKANEEQEEQEYILVYAVKSVYSQKFANCLDWINWNKPNYFLID